ncbi:DNA cytosine methyltransferase [Rubidibacter lacunae]|nr:DNA cytosine methyltransferase [Rubidibacter lacunae]
MSRPIGIDLFAGAGGLSLGFEQAGFDVVAAVELDPVHAAVHHYNFPNCAMLPKSAASLSGAEIRGAAGIGSRAVDVVFGGAPCQGFSLMGRRSLDDPRNALVREFVRLVAELDARYFVFENVKGLATGQQRQFLEEVIDAFTALGYLIRLPWQILNAVHFGVPQQRERLILMGAKRDCPLPEYPKAIARPAGKSPALAAGSLPPGPSCREAIGDLPDADKFARLAATDSTPVSAWDAGDLSAYAREMRCVEAAGWHYGYRRHWNSMVLTASARTTHTAISRRRFAAADSGRIEPISRFFKLAPDGVSNTLRAGTDSARGAFTSPRPIHYARSRCVTVREMARLHGFPDWFRPHATKWHGARQIGNAVPPPLARAIAGEIGRALGATPTLPRRIVALGEPRLVNFDMSQAARFWGVPIAIAKRTSKSGVRKRKQSDVEAARLLARDNRSGIAD